LEEKKFARIGMTQATATDAAGPNPGQRTAGSALRKDQMQ